MSRTTTCLEGNSTDVFPSVRHFVGAEAGEHAGNSPGMALLRSGVRPARRANRLGRTGSTTSKVARLIWLHFEAVRAEQLGRISRANFWWAESRKQLEHLALTDDGWSEALRDAGFPTDMTGADLRSRLIREVLIDCHLAFLHGYGPKAERCAFHREQVKRLIPLADLPSDEVDDLEIQLALEAIEADASTDSRGVALGRLLDLRSKYPTSSRIRRAARELCRRVIDESTAANQCKEALDWCNHLIELDQESPQWRNLRIRLFRDSVQRAISVCQWEDAVASADQFAANYPAVQVPETDIDSILRRGIKNALEQKMWTTAVRRLTALQERQPGVPPEQCLAVRWAAVRGSCEANRWAEALSLVDALPSAQRQVQMRLRSSIGTRMVVDLPSSLTSALEEAKKLLTLFPHDPDVHSSVVAALLGRMAEFIDALGPAETSQVAHQKAVAVGWVIDALEQALWSNPALAAAGAALAALHMRRAVSLANANRLSDALVDLERVEQYEPQFEGIAEARTQVETLLDQAGEMLKRVDGIGYRQEGGYLVKTELNAEGRALAEQVRLGTGPRNQFRSSSKAREIPARMRIARLLRLWLKAGIPVPQTRWETKAQSFDRATDLLLALSPTSADELFKGWMTVLSTNPDLALDLSEVGPEHLLAAFAPPHDEDTKVDPISLIPDFDVIWLEESSRFEGCSIPLEPEPVLAVDPSISGERAAEVPHFNVPSTAARDTKVEDVPAEFWLFSRRNMGLKAAAVAAALLLGVVGALLFLDNRRQARWDEAYSGLRQALDQKDEPTVRESLSVLREIPVFLPTRKAKSQMAAVDDVAASLGRLERLRTRDASIARLVQAIEQRNPGIARRAVTEFREASRADEHDPRQAFVDQVDRWIDELPALKARDVAYARFIKARDEDDPAAATSAAITFVRAAPMAIKDRRSKALFASAREIVSKWVLTEQQEQTDSDQQLVATWLDVSKAALK